MCERHDSLHLLPQPAKGYQISLLVSPVLPGKQKCPRTIPGRAASRRPGPPKTTALMNLNLEMAACAFCRRWTYPDGCLNAARESYWLSRCLGSYRPAQGLALIGSPNGRPMSSKALSAMVTRAALAAGLPKECVPHGLGKSAMRRSAEYGSTTKEIASMTTVCSLVDIGPVQAGRGRRCSALSFTMLLVAHSKEFVPHRKMNSQRQQ
jgi:hypothetical protein